MATEHSEPSPGQWLRYAHVVGTMVVAFEEFTREHGLTPGQLSSGVSYETLDSHLRALETAALRRGLQRAVLPRRPG